MQGSPQIFQLFIAQHILKILWKSTHAFPAMLLTDKQKNRQTYKPTEMKT